MSPYWPLSGRGVPTENCRVRNLNAENEKRRRLLGTRVRAAKAPQTPVHRSGQDTSKHTGHLATLRCRSSEFPWLPGSSLTYSVKEGVYGKPNQASLLRVILYSYFPTLFTWYVSKSPWRKVRLPTSLFMGFPGGSDGKETACNAGDLGSSPESGRSPGGGSSNPGQCSCLENPHGQRSLASYSPWGRRVGHDWATKHSTVQAIRWMKPSQ